MVFAPKTLGTLQFASMYESNDTKNRKELLKVLKKINKKIARFSQETSQFYGQEQTKTDTMALFDLLYSKREDLTVKELKILKELCDVLGKDFYLNGARFYNNEVPQDDIYDKYGDVLDGLIYQKSKKFN